MKRLFIVIALFVIANRAFSQDAVIGNNYYFKSSLSKSLTDQKLKRNTSDAVDPSLVIEYKKLVQVVNVEGGRVYFEYLKFPTDTAAKKFKGLNEAIKVDMIEKFRTYNVDDNGLTKTFSMATEDFNRLTGLYYARFRGFKYGAYTIPIRLRKSQDKFEFDSNLSLGANVLGRISLSRLKENAYCDLSVGVSLTKVNLNKDNSLLGASGTEFENIETLSPAAITLSTGVLFNLAENVNFGVYMGWDKLSSADNKAEWIYNGKTWLGVGINVAFSGGAANTGGTKN